MEWIRFVRQKRIVCRFPGHFTVSTRLYTAGLYFLKCLVLISLEMYQIIAWSIEGVSLAALMLFCFINIYVHESLRITGGQYVGNEMK